MKGPRKGFKQSEEHKRKIGIANRGKVRSLEMRLKISNANKGKRRTLEQIKNMKGRKAWNKDISGYLNRSPKGRLPEDRQKIRNAITVEWQNKNKGRVLNNRLKWKYGIDKNDFDSMLTTQNNVCAICSGPDKIGWRLTVDHNHETGKIRGLLCGHCNRGLGLFMDNPQILLAAINYLIQSN